VSRPAPLTCAQQEVVADLDRNWCVTSGAGCGKTRVLVERYLRFLEEDPELPLERLAAITFTEMAAAEMRDRIRQACRARLDEARTAGDAVRVERWLERYWDVDIAPIHTIHGFAAAILKRFPIEAGVDPNFEMLDEASADLLLQEVVCRTIEELLEAEDADILTMLEHYSLPRARAILAEIVGKHREVLRRVAEPVMARSDAEILKDLARRNDELVREACAEVLADAGVVAALGNLRKFSGKAADKREAIRRRMLEVVDRIAGARTADVATAALDALLAIRLGGGSVKNWPSAEALNAVGEAAKTVKGTFKKAAADLPKFDKETEREHLAVARAMYRTAQRVQAAYDKAKRRRSGLDFEDLQVCARDLLRSDARVLKTCRRAYRAILVDELQDTNLLQFELVDLLTSAAGKFTRRGGCGKAGPLRPGAFFGVGDPKQSIYRFRGAEIEVFERALGRVGAKGRKGLARSFRLNPGIAGLVNHLFPPLMGERYEPIEPAHEQKNAHAAEWLHTVDPEGNGFPAEAGYAAEAQQLAGRIHEMCAAGDVQVWDDGRKAWRPAQYGDVAILLRRTSYLHLYEEALERRGVPYYVVAGRGFYKQQEVLDVLHLLRALDDPSDDLAVAGVLRSPFFAVSDEGLYRLRPLGRTLLGALEPAAEAPGFDAEDQRGLGRASRFLPAWSRRKDQMGLASLVDAVVFDSGYAAAAVARFGGARAYANLRQMAELARRFEHEGLASLGDYIDYVTDFMQSEMRQEQASIDAPEDGQVGGSVRIMTIHKAKGLEFPIVAIPDLGYASRGPRADYFIHPATGLAARLRDEEGKATMSCALVLARREDKRAEADEAIRLLYVAMTRAKDYAIFTSHQPHNSMQNPTWQDVLATGLRAGMEEGSRVATLPGGCTVRVSACVPGRDSGRHGRRRVGPRDVFAAGRVRWDVVRSRAEGAPRGRLEEVLAQVSPPEAPPRPPQRVAATALDVYRRCPTEYWWTHVLGVEEPEPKDATAGAPEGGGLPLSPRERGLIYHRALELAASPIPQDIRSAVEEAIRRADYGTGAGHDRLALHVTKAVSRFWASELGRRLASANATYRELPMLLQFGETEIRGVIDLVFENPDGTWELADYKSHLPPDETEGLSADAYRLQLGLYATAVSRWTGEANVRCSVYVLESGDMLDHDASAEALDVVERETTEALSAIAEGDFRRRDEKRCQHCRFGRLCSREPTV
jgi:ATP-dependent helicase/nuclease subunit A